MYDIQIVCILQIYLLFEGISINKKLVVTECFAWIVQIFLMINEYLIYRHNNFNIDVIFRVFIYLFGRCNLRISFFMPINNNNLFVGCNCFYPL